LTEDESLAEVKTDPFSSSHSLSHVPAISNNIILAPDGHKIIISRQKHWIETDHPHSHSHNHSEFEPDAKRARLGRDVKSEPAIVNNGENFSKLRLELTQCARNNSSWHLSEPSFEVVVIEGVAANGRRESLSNSSIGVTPNTKIVVAFDPVGAAFTPDVRGVLPSVSISGGRLPVFAPAWNLTVSPSAIKDGTSLFVSFMEYIARWTAVSTEMEHLKKNFTFKVTKSHSSVVLQCAKNEYRVPLPAIYMLIPFSTSQPITYRFGPEYDNPDIAFLKQKF
jgi:hypothetical protein